MLEGPNRAIEASGMPWAHEVRLQVMKLKWMGQVMTLLLSEAALKAFQMPWMSARVDRATPQAHHRYEKD